MRGMWGLEVRPSQEWRPENAWPAFLRPGAGGAFGVAGGLSVVPALLAGTCPLEVAVSLTKDPGMDQRKRWNPQEPPRSRGQLGGSNGCGDGNIRIRSLT